MQTKTEIGSYLEWAKAMRARVRDIAGEWEGEEGNLIMILHAIQNEFGYISRGAADELTKASGVSMARIYEVITFYHYFRLTPPGNHTVQVCMGTACYLKGAETLQKELEKQMRLLESGGGAKGDFHVETVRCIGCCGMAPAVMVDGETHGRLCPADIAELLKRKAKE